MKLKISLMCLHKEIQHLTSPDNESHKTLVSLVQQLSIALYVVSRLLNLRT